MAILLLQVDSDEQTPIGVYPRWVNALTAAADNDFSADSTPAPLDSSLREEFSDAFGVAFEPYERATSDEGMDLTWQSPGGWFYRIVWVSVYGEVS